MRQVSIKQLHRSPSEELGKLPFIITKRGKAIARVTPLNNVTPKTKQTQRPVSNPVIEFRPYSKEIQLKKGVKRKS